MTGYAAYCLGRIPLLRTPDKKGSYFSFVMKVTRLQESSSDEENEDLTWAKVQKFQSTYPKS